MQLFFFELRIVGCRWEEYFKPTGIDLKNQVDQVEEAPCPRSACNFVKRLRK